MSSGWLLDPDGNIRARQMVTSPPIYRGATGPGLQACLVLSLFPFSAQFIVTLMLSSKGPNQ